MRTPGGRHAGAAVPLPSPERQVNTTLTIESEGDGYLLIVESEDGSLSGDTWHATIADAQRQAEASYKVPISAWPTSKPTAG